METYINGYLIVLYGRFNSNTTLVIYTVNGLYFTCIKTLLYHVYVEEEVYAGVIKLYILLNFTR